MKIGILQKKIQTKELTLQFLREQGLISVSQKCPKCRNDMILRKVPLEKSSDCEEFVCYKRTCRSSRSIRYNSFFENSKLEIEKIVLFIHLWSKMYPPEIIMDDFEFSKQTITDWSRFCRDLLVENFDQSMSSKIGGENRVVEIDESLLVRRKYNRGRLLKQQWMFGGIERNTSGQRKFFVEFVESRTEETLIPIILRRIKPGTTVISDGWRAYSNLNNLGFLHEVIIHDENFVDPNDSEVHTQNVEGMWSVLKRFLRKHGTHRSPHEFEYVAEFFFRWGKEDIFKEFFDLLKIKYPFNLLNIFLTVFTSKYPIAGVPKNLFDKYTK